MMRLLSLELDMMALFIEGLFCSHRAKVGTEAPHNGSNSIEAPLQQLSARPCLRARSPATRQAPQWKAGTPRLEEYGHIQKFLN